MGWRGDLRHYFILNKRERRGFAYLLALFFILIIIRISIPYLHLEENNLNAAQKTKLETLRAQFKETQSEEVVKNQERGIQNNFNDLQPIVFNPNTVDEQTLLQLGLLDWQARRFIKYRGNKGRFREASDILAVYGIDSNWVEMMTPYMNFNSPGASAGIDEGKKSLSFTGDESKTTAASKDRINKPKEKSISLNMADTSELKKIPGIGSFFAKTLVQHRQKLGGFFGYDQLLDIPYMKEDAMTAFVTYTYINSSEVIKLNLNSCSIEQLGQHPYLTWAQARAIVNYRKQHGSYKKLEEIQKTDVISPADYVKIAPYLFVP
jgi:DNA uptake protein ComE-like DNA-binding protein